MSVKSQKQLTPLRQADPQSSENFIVKTKPTFLTKRRPGRSQNLPLAPEPSEEVKNETQPLCHSRESSMMNADLLEFDYSPTVVVQKRQEPQIVLQLALAPL